MFKKLLNSNANSSTRRNSDPHKSIPTNNIEIINDDELFINDQYNNIDPNNSPRRHSLPECLTGIKGLALNSLDTIEEVFFS